MTDEEFQAYRELICDDHFRFHELDEAEQAALLGKDIGLTMPGIVVELDEATQGRMYRRRYGMLQIELDWYDTGMICVFLGSCDDGDFEIHIRQDNNPDLESPLRDWQIRDAIIKWLARTSYYLNAVGLGDACHAWGKVESVEWTL